MKEKLIIKNFGPIKSIDLDLGKITVLIGEQASGKSTIAKVLSMCRYFSYIINNKSPLISRSRFIDYGLREWNLEGYQNSKTYIYYESEDYIFEVKTEKNDDGTVYFSQSIKGESPGFDKLIEQLDLYRPNFIDQSNDNLSWDLPHSFLTTDVKKVMNNPFYIQTERGLQSIFSLGKSSIQNLSDALFNQFALQYHISGQFKSETSIEPLGLQYKSIDGVGYFKGTNDKKFYKLSQGASGYQSTIPIVLAIKYYSEIEKRKRTFIVEEPEQNLFPTAQKKLVEFIAKSINKHKNQFLLPTHSPYILTTLSNLIYAHKIGTMEKGKYEKEVDKVIPKKSWIDVNDVSVYYLNEGDANNMIDIEECIINVDDLDNVSEIINKEFDELLNIEVKDNSNE